MSELEEALVRIGEEIRSDERAKVLKEVRKELRRRESLLDGMRNMIAVGNELYDLQQWCSRVERRPIAEAK